MSMTCSNFCATVSVLSAYWARPNSSASIRVLAEGRGRGLVACFGLGSLSSSHSSAGVGPFVSCILVFHVSVVFTSGRVGLS